MRAAAKVPVAPSPWNIPRPRLRQLTLQGQVQLRASAGVGRLKAPQANQADLGLVALQALQAVALQAHQGLVALQALQAVALQADQGLTAVQAEVLLALRLVAMHAAALLALRLVALAH
jgi:hypothetical protein